MARRFRSSGALESQILEDDSTVTAAGITSSEFTELTHRTSPVVLRRLRGYVYCRAGSSTNGDDERVRFAIIKHPIGAAIPTPTSGDYGLIQNNVWEIDCTCNRSETLKATPNEGVWGTDIPAWVHFDLNLKVVIPLDWKLFFSVLNEGDITNFFNFVVRLFWKRF